jgi:hypothetical protein
MNRLVRNEDSSSWGRVCMILGLPFSGRGLRGTTDEACGLTSRCALLRFLHHDYRTGGWAYWQQVNRNKIEHECT